MKGALTFFLLLICSFLFGQTTIVNTSADLGDLYSSTQRYVDIPIQNKGTKMSYLLRIQHGPEISYRISTDKFVPDSTVTLRLQVNPTKKGKFQHEVYVYFSDAAQPTVIRVKGNVVELPGFSGDQMTRCPDFNASPSSVRTKELTIITVDKETGLPLAQSKVAIIRNGEPAGAWITGRKGAFSAAIPSGYFYFLATHEGYLKKEAGVFVGPEISEITIPLRKDPAFSPPPPTPDPEPIAEEPIQLPNESVVEIIQEQAPVKDTAVEKIPELAQLPPTEFSKSYFNDVNVVFVLDVSSSMKLGEKMDLMKYALNQLVSNLRPDDIMGLVTYSDNAEVFQAPTKGANKEAIQTAVSELRPRGMTAGGKGIKLGYKQVLKNYDAGKTNIVVVITDGAFNKDSDDYQKIVRKYAKKGIIFSVVGIQTKDRDVSLMQEAADFGKGRYVHIQEITDAQYKLLNEIRIASFKGK